MKREIKVVLYGLAKGISCIESSNVLKLSVRNAIYITTPDPLQCTVYQTPEITGNVIYIQNYKIKGQSIVSFYF